MAKKTVTTEEISVDPALDYLKATYAKWDGKVVDADSALLFFKDMTSGEYPALNSIDEFDSAFVTSDMNIYFDAKLAKVYSFEKSKDLFTIKIK